MGDAATSDAHPGGESSVFEERLTGRFAPDAWPMALPLLGLAGVLWVLGVVAPALVVLGLGIFTAAFFRNPKRRLPDDPTSVVAPADGRVIAVGEVERADGSKARGWASSSRSSTST